MEDTTKKWQGDISEEMHIALHYCKNVHDCDATAKRIKEYGDRRVNQEKFISINPMLANVPSSVSCVDCGKQMREDSCDYKKLADGIVCRMCIGDRCID